MSASYYGPNEVSKELFTRQLVESPPPVISLDIETPSLKEQFPIGFSIAVSPVESWYFRTYPENDPEVELIRLLLNNPAIKKVMHNAIFDLRNFPLVYDIDRSNIWDTNVAARLLGHIETKLKTLSGVILSREIETSEDLLTRHSAKDMRNVPVEEVAAMCAVHSQCTLQLYYEFVDKIDKEYFAVEMRVIPILIDMSLRGLGVVEEDRAALEAQLLKEQDYYKQILLGVDIENPNSTQQVGYILAKRGNFLPFTKSKKQYRTDEETLEFVEDPIASVVQSYRKITKVLDTYILPLRGKDRIYTNYNLDAVVGRVSSSDVNMQNIPPRNMGKDEILSEGCRYIFYPDSGTFTSGDYSQEHTRIIMHKSGDKQMRRIFEEGECGGDIHQFFADKMHKSRKLGKTINLAIPYGATPYTIRTRAKIKDLKLCASYLDFWLKTFPDAAEWIRGIQKSGFEEGWAEPTLFGRRIRIPEEFNAWGKLDEDAMKRKAVNYPVLGSDGEIIKRALIICEDKGLPLAVTIHDNITCDGDVEFPIEELENISPVHIPFEVSKSERWE